MSTITSPREGSVGERRIPPMSTPTSSSRPSLENPRSETASPNRGQQPRRNRAALREYYNLKKTQESIAITADDAQSEASSVHDYSEVQESEVDRQGFDGEAYVKTVLETKTLGELLGIYNGILTDIRALDAEKKALVYDNYSKLIAATETIRKMRKNMDPLNRMASTLDPAISSIYERAERIKAELREGMTESQRKEWDMSVEEREAVRKKERVRAVVLRVLDTPERLRILFKEEREEEARTEWEATRKVLERWSERGVGGDDVQACIDDGEAALRGEPPNEKSWVYTKGFRESES